MIPLAWRRAPAGRLWGWGVIDEDEDWLDGMNPDSLEVLPGCKVEPSLIDAPVGSRVQFERQGYFCVAPDSTEDKLVFNRTLSLRDTWAKIQNQQKSGKK